MEQNQYNFNILQDSIEAAEMVRDFAIKHGDDDAVDALNYGIGRMRDLYDKFASAYLEDQLSMTQTIRDFSASRGESVDDLDDEIQHIQEKVHKSAIKFAQNTVTGLVKPEMYEN